MSATYVSRITAVGRSAVAVVSVIGPQAEAYTRVCFEPATSASWNPGQIRYGTWRADKASQSDEAEGESVVLTPLAENHFEIHGHGGAAAVNRIIQSLVDLGATKIDSAKFTHVSASFRDQEFEPLIAEAESVLTQCTTRRNAATALGQTRGSLLRWTCDWIDRIHTEIAGDELEKGSNNSSSVLLAELRASASDVLLRASTGMHLTAPYRVVLAGPPNVGKSSLVNRIVGYGRSITHDAAGTTRDVVDCDTVIDGLAIRLGDTAGIRAGGDVIEQEGIRRGSLAIANADLVVMVLDPNSLADADSIQTTITSHNPDASILRVLNKADRLLETAEETHSESKWLRTIAHDAEALQNGIEALMKAISSTLRPLEFDHSSAMPIVPRHVHWLSQIVGSANLRQSLERLTALRSGAEIGQ
ncbi:GTPase [Rhodopirellula sp. SWK7]|uniref:GTPase n=1 Tax=Rhodopirellula sp. SWK7 TaxID=595460 RepID=UPI000347CF5E|nr:GTPase [Rhodopirellula sp. SWK7]